MPPDRSLDELSADELRGRLAVLLECLAGMPVDDPARGLLVMQRLDVAAALRRVTGDPNGQLAAWAERSSRPADQGRPYIPSPGEGGGFPGSG